ncbi:hypothetical protein GCM10018965_074620 [Nonomuraea roseola]
MRLPVSGDERVLYGISRLVGVAQRAQGDRPHAVAVPLDYLTERMLIPVEVPGEQLGVREWLRWGIHKVYAVPGEYTTTS